MAVVERPASKVGRIIIDGFFEPERVIKLIMVVGKNCSPALANIMVIIMGNVMVPDLSSMCSIVLIPRGTDATPMPKRLAEIESVRYFFASFERFLPQNNLIIGERHTARY